MTNEQDDERSKSRPQDVRDGRLRLVPPPVPAPQSSDEDESLRDLIRRVQRPSKRRTPPSDDPPRAA